MQTGISIWMSETAWFGKSRYRDNTLSHHRFPATYGACFINSKFEMICLVHYLKVPRSIIGDIWFSSVGNRVRGNVHSDENTRFTFLNEVRHVAKSFN